MFLGLGMSEIAVVALLALLIIGPKDLPVMLRTLGNGWKQLMQLRREFMRTVNAFMRENDLDEVRNAAKAVQQFRPPSAADLLDPDRSLRKDLADIDQEVKAATEATTEAEAEPKAKAETETSPDASDGAQNPAPPPAGIGRGAVAAAPSTAARSPSSKSAGNSSASPTAKPSKRPAAADSPGS